MYKYIWCKKKMEKAISICGLLFWIVNLVFFQVSINMLVKILYSSKTDWFQIAAEKESLEDDFFLDRIEFIMNTITLILIAVVLFSMITLILFRKIQLKNMLTQMGVYRVAGYSKVKITGISVIDVLVDIVVAFLASIMLSNVTIKIVSSNELMSMIMEVTEFSVVTDLLIYTICMLLMLMVVIVYSYIFVCGSIKKGVSYMLGKGIV